MKIVKVAIYGLVGVIVLGLGGLFLTGNGAILGFAIGYMFGAPDLPFDPTDVVAAPDYSEESNWAALPQRDDLGDLIPAGMVREFEQGDSPVDVFYIHPTGFLKGSSWIYTMDPDTSSEENTKWMIANQASSYNGCCNVYAPRYRQASIYAYFSGDAVRDEVLAFAYQDVERAFDYFLENYNEGRPFVLASHSQGTHHGLRLLQERIDDTPLAQQLVAAFIIGGGIKTADVEKMNDIGVCGDPTELGCVVHWDTFSESEMERLASDEPGNLCVNPLSWEHNGGLAQENQNLGAVPASGEYHLAIMGSDEARGVEFGPLGEPMPGFVHARCDNGRLFVTDLSDTPFAAGAMGGTYHGLDYVLFYMDIRDNAIARVEAYLATREALEEAGETP